MCVVSMAGDYWKDRIYPNYPTTPGIPVGTYPFEYASKADLDKIRADLEALRELLIAAKKFDAAVGEPDCEHDDKVDLIKKLAKHLGVDMKEVFGE